jgi:nitrite reductase (NO-forming)
MYNGFAELYVKHPLPVKTNETVRVYLINMGLSPAYGMHIHGSLFKAYPSGIWQNPSMRVQSWELASGNAAILEGRWPWTGKFTFHSHGIPEEYGAMGYFNVTDAPANAEDGKDIAITKSINMMDWQANLTKSIQKADSKGNVTNISNNPHIGNHDDMPEMRNGMEQDQTQASANNSNANQVLIVKDAAALGDKSYSPNPITVKVGTTVTWLDKDRDMHTVTSGLPNSEDAGEFFDSGLTALIMPAKIYSHKFTHLGEFPYFCRIHPTMIGMVNVVS